MNQTHRIDSLPANTSADLKLQVIAVTGASGFIGKALVDALLHSGCFEVRTLSRDGKISLKSHSCLKEIQGDLGDATTIRNFLSPGCTVINLAFGRNQSPTDNILLTKNLIHLCHQYRIKRLIHCSTASVCGHRLTPLIDEETPCYPSNEYGRTKLLIEELLREGGCDHYEFINLRPTSVFGPTGLALNKLINDLKTKNLLINYIKSCLFAKRKMNLVSIDLVVASILFFVKQHPVNSGQTYFISQDDQEPNDFSSIEKIIMKEIVGKRYPIQQFPPPAWCLSLVIFLLGRGYVNPLTTFSPAKLHSLNIPHSKLLIESINEFLETKKFL